MNRNYPRPRSLPGLIALAMIALMGARPALPQDTGPSLELVPHPDLATLDPAVRERLTPGVTFFREQRGTLDGSALGLAYGRMGINYLAHEQYDAAGACLRNAAALDSGNPRWPYLVGYLYEATDRPDDAIAAYRVSLKINQGYWQGFQRLGEVLLETDRLDEADAAFDVVLTRNRDEPRGLMGAADVALGRGNASEAISLYQRGLRGDPEANLFHRRLAEAYRQLGDEAAASREAARAGDRPPRLVDPLIAFVDAHTRGVAYYREAAKNAQAAGDIPIAIKFYEIATSLQPDDIESLLAMGELRGAVGDLDGALSTFARVTLLDPDNARANYFTGRLLELRGDELQAAAFYEAAITTTPELVEPRMLLANGLMRRGDYLKAADHYAVVAQQLPRNVEVAYLLGLAWIAGNQCEWAHKSLRRAVSLQPGDRQVLTALARAYSTCTVVTDEQRTEALQAAAAMYERSADGATAETLAMAAAANGMYEDAVELQTQAIFEALRRGDQAEISWLRQNLVRYEEQQPAVRPWPPESEVFRPRALKLQPAPAAAG